MSRDAVVRTLVMVAMFSKHRDAGLGHTAAILATVAQFKAVFPKAKGVSGTTVKRAIALVQPDRQSECWQFVDERAAPEPAVRFSMRWGRRPQRKNILD